MMIQIDFDIIHYAFIDTDGGEILEQIEISFGLGSDWRRCLRLWLSASEHSDINFYDNYI